MQGMPRKCKIHCNSWSYEIAMLEGISDETAFRELSINAAIQL